MKKARRRIFSAIRKKPAPEGSLRPDFGPRDLTWQLPYLARPTVRKGGELFVFIGSIGVAYHSCSEIGIILKHPVMVSYLYIHISKK